MNTMIQLTLICIGVIVDEVGSLSRVHCVVLLQKKKETLQKQNSKTTGTTPYKKRQDTTYGQRQKM